MVKFEFIAQAITALIGLGMIIGVYVRVIGRVTTMETRITTKADCDRVVALEASVTQKVDGERIASLEAIVNQKADTSILLERMDEMRIAIENKIEYEVTRMREDFKK
jgi:hypothetical protein